jgi:hypothetical protein
VVAADTLAPDPHPHAMTYRLEHRLVPVEHRERGNPWV